MTAITNGLTLYCMLDRIETGKLLDLSGSGRHGTAAGNPQIVVDETFGHCLSLDGVDDWVTLPKESLPEGQQLTISLWLNGASSLPLATSVLEARDAQGQRVLNLHIPWNLGQIFFDCGNVGAEFDRTWRQAQQPADYKGSWSHWTFVKNAAAGEMRIYRNGVLWQSGTSLVRPVRAASALRLGAMTDGTYKYPGKVAHLRIYNRALSAGEIGEVMQEDKSALAAFRNSHPLEINLNNSAGEAVLYITDSPGGNRTSLEITNTSGRVIKVPVSSSPVAAGNHHFALRFRPGTVSIAQENPTGWTAKTDLSTDGTAILYLLSSQDRSLEPGATLTIPLPSLTVDATGGARGTRAEARYRQLGYANDSTPLQGVRTLHLSILKLRFVGRDILWSNNSILKDDQGGSLELGGEGNIPGTGTPYIDFHYNGKSQDYNVRLVNDADGQLSVIASHLRITGIFSALNKLFRIAHPTKPNHDLVHACLEGPESAVYYRGVARLVEGQATVRLPEYFEALTRQEGRTVQLTAKGREPFLVSYDDIVDGAFRIYGSKPDGEVSWEVKAVRSDVEELVVEVGKA